MVHTGAKEMTWNDDDINSPIDHHHGKSTRNAIAVDVPTIMAVRQHVLNWLYSVLTSEYHDVNRTYNDVAQALTAYPTLSPRTDVHTTPDGKSALLVHLSGTLPVVFRGTTYRFPVSIWVPHAYPRDAPIVYVTPTDAMAVRPGQHVDPQGMVYHPYLAGWPSFWDKSRLVDFLAILRDVFAKEPPVVARRSSAEQIATQPDHGAPPMSMPIPMNPDETTRPPAPPPRPGRELSRDHRPGPPLPPLPPGRAAQPSRASLVVAPSRYDSAPAYPPHGQVPPQHQHQNQQPQPPQRLQHHHQQPQQAQQQQPQQPPTWNQSRQAPLPRVQDRPVPRGPPPPDLMDQDLALTIPSPSWVVAPPIPPNPEKDALLHQLASTLHAQRRRAHEQDTASLAGLQAQRTAMLSSLSAMQADLSALSQLSALLGSNAAILQESIRRADGVIESSSRHPAPAIDELLVAQTVVGNQLYELVAEERALADAVFLLGRAVERGRVAPATFAKTTRSLAREWYLKKALVRKIGRGMGLA